MKEINEMTELIKGDIISNPNTKSNYRVDKAIYNVHSKSYLVNMTPIAPYNDKMFSFTMDITEMMALGYYLAVN